MMLLYYGSSIPAVLSGIANTTLGPSVGPSRTGREKKEKLSKL
jgi:hypothetical protein